MVNHKMPFRCKNPQGRVDMTVRSHGRLIKLTRILVAIIFCYQLRIPVNAAVLPPASDTYNLILAWNPSSSPDVVACKLYYGTISREYTDYVTVGNVTSVTISNLVQGVTYYFAITAINADGQESDYSDEVSYSTPPPQAPPQSVQVQPYPQADGSVLLSINGSPGDSYDIEATGDFINWTVIGTATLDADGSADFTDVAAVNYPQRFYRVSENQPGPPTVVSPQLQLQQTTDGQILLSSTGPAGNTYYVEATEDLVSWAVIGTVTLDAGGSMDFTDTDAPNYSQRFYRLAENPPTQPTIVPAQIQVGSFANGQFTLTVTGTINHPYDIEATEDLVTWTVIGTVTLDAGGSADFTDSDAANYPQRFYRARDNQAGD
jgi:hypothetical protein